MDIINQLPKEAKEEPYASLIREYETVADNKDRWVPFRIAVALRNQCSRDKKDDIWIEFNKITSARDH